MKKNYFAFNSYGIAFGKSAEKAKDALRYLTLEKIKLSGYKNPLKVFKERCRAFGLVDATNLDVGIWTDDVNAYRQDTNEIINHSVEVW